MISIGRMCYTINLATDSHVDPPLVLMEGDTEIGKKGTDSITLSYRKGAL